MRKIKVLFLSLIALLCTVFGIACGEVKPSGTYSLQIDDPNGYVLEDISGYYAFGAELDLKIAFTSGIDVKPYLNGAEITNRELVEKHGTYYYEFSFKMPPRPSVIKISPPYDPDEDIEPMPPISGMNTAIFTVGYDYGFHQQTSGGEGVATLLLDGCLPFFDFNDYNLPMPILAGDELTVYYTGEMLTQESYPGKVVIQDGKVEWVEKTNHAQIVELVYANDEIDGGKYYFPEYPAYVINLDGTCTPLENIEEGSLLYGAFVEEYIPGALPTPGVKDDCIQPDIMVIVSRLTGLYSYHPDYTVSAESLLPWVDNVNAENVTEMTRRVSNPSVGPNALVTIEETTNTTDIQNFVEYLKELTFRRISKAEGQIDGGAVVKYTIATADGETYEYSTYAGNYYAEETYRPVSQPPVMTGSQTYYQFPDILSDADFYLNGNFEQRYENILTGITFKHTDSQDLWGELSQKLVLDADGILIYIRNKTSFYIENGSGADIGYDIVSEKDFSQIYDDYVYGTGKVEADEGEYALNVIGGVDRLYQNPRGSYLAGEEITVYIEQVFDSVTYLYVNGAILEDETSEKINGWYLKKYQFKMPAKDSILYISCLNGFLGPYEEVKISAEYVSTGSLIENEKNLYKLSTVEDMQEYLQSLSGSYDTESEMQAACEKYDEEYFAKNDLLLVVFSAPSNSISYRAESLILYYGQEEKTVLTIDEILPEGDGDCAMRQWHILIELGKHGRVKVEEITLEFI